MSLFLYFVSERRLIPQSSWEEGGFIRGTNLLFSTWRKKNRLHVELTARIHQLNSVIPLNLQLMNTEKHQHSIGFCVHDTECDTAEHSWAQTMRNGGRSVERERSETGKCV